jgi:hypothetical protein
MKRFMAARFHGDNREKNNEEGSGEMPNLDRKKWPQVPIGRYDCEFVGVESFMRAKWESPSEEEAACRYKFVGTLTGDTSGKTREITVIVADKGGDKASQPKLVARMGGSTTKDEFGLTCHPALLKAMWNEVRELAARGFPTWHGKRFLVEVVSNGEDEDGDPRTKATWETVYRWPGEPRLLDPQKAKAERDKKEPETTATAAGETLCEKCQKPLDSEADVFAIPLLCTACTAA